MDGCGIQFAPPKPNGIIRFPNLSPSTALLLQPHGFIAWQSPGPKEAEGMSADPSLPQPPNAPKNRKRLHGELQRPRVEGAQVEVRDQQRPAQVWDHLRLSWQALNWLGVSSETHQNQAQTRPEPTLNKVLKPLLNRCKLKPEVMFGAVVGMG